MAAAAAGEGQGGLEEAIASSALGNAHLPGREGEAAERVVGARLAVRRKMAALSAPLRTLRALLRELRHAAGRHYRDSPAYRHVLAAFRAHRVTSEKLCRAQQELHFQAATYLCLLRSVREHEALHREYHGKGERSPEEVAGLVGFRLPQQPGGKG